MIPTHVSTAECRSRCARRRPIQAAVTRDERGRSTRSCRRSSSSSAGQEKKRTSTDPTWWQPPSSLRCLPYGSGDHQTRLETRGITCYMSPWAPLRGGSGWIKWMWRGIRCSSRDGRRRQRRESWASRSVRAGCSQLLPLDDHPKKDESEEAVVVSCQVESESCLPLRSETSTARAFLL
jgi:hypothetical protein